MSEPLEQRLREGLARAASFEPRTAQARARFERLTRRRRLKTRIRTASLAAAGATLVLATVGGVGFTKDIRDRLGFGDPSGSWSIGINGADEDSATKDDGGDPSESGAGAVEGDAKSPVEDSNPKDGAGAAASSNGGSVANGDAGAGGNAAAGEGGTKGTTGTGSQGSGAPGVTDWSDTGLDACPDIKESPAAGQSTEAAPSDEGGAAGAPETSATPTPSPTHTNSCEPSSRPIGN
jgi:hypothetical protein